MVSNVMGGNFWGESNAKDFKTCINEFLAFQINSEAKFTKVYREGASKCFLMPAEFKDDAIRDFFRVKFEEFCNSSRRVMRSGEDHSENLFSSRRGSITGKADFAEEHLQRRKFELEYAKNSKLESTVVDDDRRSDDDSRSMTNDYFADKQEVKGVNCSQFNAEIERAEKNFLDAREVCLSEWNVRDGTHELLEKLCSTMKDIISGKLVDSDCKE